jgi:aerobic carbon-monoxide dehydrogenase medium subunit
MEIARRQGDYAMMGLAALVTCDVEGVCQDARLVFLNAGDGPVLATAAAQLLRGQKASAELFNAVADTAAEREIDPLGSVHATVSYQRHLARVLTRRVLARAFDRALGGSQPNG